MVLDFFSNQWGVLASQTVWINSVAPRSSGCSQTVVAWRCALLSCQNREVQVFGWSDGQMESVTAYSKHLVWLTRRTTHLFSLLPFPQLIASIFVLSHHLNPVPRLFFFKKEFFLKTFLLFSGCCVFSVFVLAALTDVSRRRGTRLICCQGRYAADRRSRKQDFKNTPQEGLFLVDYERGCFSSVLQKGVMEIFQWHQLTSPVWEELWFIYFFYISVF